MPKASPAGRQAISAAAVAAAYVALSLVWIQQSHGTISTLVWLPAGLGPAALARWPSLWPGILTGLVTAEVGLDILVFAPDDPRYWIQWPVVHVVAALAGAWVLRRTGSDRLDAPKKMVGLAAAGAATSVLFGLSTLIDGNSWLSAATAFTSEFGGFVLVAPVVLSLARGDARPVRRSAILLAALCLGLLLLWVAPHYTTRAAPWAAVMIALACAAAALAGIEIASLTLIFVMAALTDSAAWAGFVDADADEASGVLIRLSMAVFSIGLGTLALVRDAAVAREREANRTRNQLRAMARTDPLTGVGNRRSIPSRTDGSDGIVALFDIDNLKRINDSFDHTAGDQAIIHFSSLLTDLAPPGSVVARLGGDEFLLMAEISLADAETVVEELTAALADTRYSQQTPVPLTASVGLAAYTPNADTWEAVQRADIALVTAKLGRSRRATFNESMRDSATSIVAVEAQLTAALHSGGIRAYVQPIVDALSGGVMALEVLARLEPAGSPGPDQFIPVAMRTGMGGAVEMAVLEDLLRTFGDERHSSESLSLNSSPQNLMRPDYPDQLLAMLARHGIAPHRIILEVTEDDIVREYPVVTRSVETLRTAGVRLALDDFGTRSSALTAVTTLNPQIVKVDLSFVQAAAAGEAGATAIIRALVVMAQELGMQVVAEGVETRQQSQRMTELGITLQQGYLFARPMPASEWDGFSDARVPWQASGPANDTPRPAPAR